LGRWKEDKALQSKFESRVPTILAHRESYGHTRNELIKKEAAFAAYRGAKMLYQKRTLNWLWGTNDSGAVLKRSRQVKKVRAKRKSQSSILGSKKAAIEVQINKKGAKISPERLAKRGKLRGEETHVLGKDAYREKLRTEGGSPIRGA